MAAVLDKPQINLANVKTSITSIVEAQLDKINTMESSREIFLFIRDLFDKHNIDTKKSREIIRNLATMRNVENARAYIYNFCLKGEGQGTLEIDKKPRYKSKMFKIDEKLKKIVSEDIEKIEVETAAEEITVETDGDAVKVEVEPKAAECADCRIPVESTADLDDYAFFSDLNPETDIDDIPADAEPDGSENVEESLFKESAQGTYSMRMYDYIDEYLDNEGRKDLCYAFTKWLSDDEVHEFAKANDLVPVFEDEESLTETKNSSSWDSLLDTADNLLDELIKVSNNTDYDDGDGYWESENEWCFRKMYYGAIPDSSQLEVLCNKYSKKLPNVEFYFIEDDDISEIGYIATRDESLTESTEKQYVAIDTQDKDNKDNNRKYTEKQLIDFAKELIKIEEESSEPDQYKKRPELKDDLASAKKVLKYFMYDVKEAE